MRLSQYFMSTSKQTPREGQSVSHKLMLRAGLVRQLAAGIYSYLPLGYRILAKISTIIEEEMDKIGGQQVLLPSVQPASLWKRSGRWESYGEELLRFRDRKKGEFVIGPTHEEVVTQLVGAEINSYKRLPVTLYQIQTKFRDELRSRGGVIRTREFLMKDAYSFCRSEEEENGNYQQMRGAYGKIFSRCGLDCKVVEADTGPIGGKRSEEFIAISPSGEDKLVECSTCGYAANLERAVFKIEKEGNNSVKEMRQVPTPGTRSVEEVSRFLGSHPGDVLKSLFYQTEKGLVMALIRGNRPINESKLKSVLKVGTLQLASHDLVKEKVGVEVGFAGPVGLDGYQVIADGAVMRGRNFVAGANKKDTHLVNVNPERDFQATKVGDIGYPIMGDGCANCGHVLSFRRGIEVGHLFYLGESYSRSLDVTFLDEMGKERYFVTGCYGIGVSRLPAAVIEQNHDEAGIIWPKEIAPFHAVIIPTTERTFAPSRELYYHLKEARAQVLWDDRNMSAGVKFNDADLIGIPFKIIIGDTFLEEGKIEIKSRREGTIKKMTKNKVSQGLRELIEDAR